MVLFSMSERAIVFAIIICFITAAPCFAKRKHPEKWYQEKWCKEHNGETEVRLPDKTRCDCITATHAVEIKFADNWYEAVGQALYYSMQTGKLPGIVLIVENIDERKYWIRLQSVIIHFNIQITVWTN